MTLSACALVSMLATVSTTLAASAAGADPVSYRLDVAPILSKAGCNAGACHGNGQGKGGFQLSLRGEDPDADWLAITRHSQARRINLHDPGASLLLLKPSGQVAHEGGQRFVRGSRADALLRRWIAEGAQDDGQSAPRVIGVRITPPEAIVVKASSATATLPYTQQLRVVANLSDGTARDVTLEATYELNDPARAEISEGGLVTSGRSGEVAVTARFLDARATARLAFLADRPDFVWRDPAPVNVIDERVFAKLRALKIHPAPPSTDEVFVRRVFLDTIGVLPTTDEVKEFLASADADKRARLIDQLLRRPEFADFWALKWADVLRNEQKTMGPKGVWIFQRWLRDQMAVDMPLDQFARDLLTAEGSTWRNPPASFYRTNRDPQTCAETVGQVFLGVRLQCARCHNHPFDVWTQDDYYGLAAAFANLGRKQIDNKRKDQFDKHEINGDELIFESGSPTLRQPRSGATMQPKMLGEPPISLATGDGDARDELVTALVGQRQFARVMANRIWYHLVGQAVVDPVDDFRDSNPPSNAALLEALADEFVKGGQRIRPLATLILNSYTYQASSATDETNVDDETNFSHAKVRLLPAEVLLDAIAQALDVPTEDRRGFPVPRATQLAVVPNNPFLKAFGKPDRLLTCDCERSDVTTLAQAFQLINGPEIRKRLDSGNNRIGRLLDAKTPADTILDALYLACISRLPTATERARLVEHVEHAENRRAAWEDIAWAVINSKEFLLRH